MRFSAVAQDSTIAGWKTYGCRDESDRKLSLTASVGSERIFAIAVRRLKVELRRF
jgi:hypothetical protein